MRNAGRLPDALYPVYRLAEVISIPSLCGKKTHDDI
jgi:hypothetical protein